MVTPKHLYAQYKMPQVKLSFHDFDAGLGVGVKLISQELDAAVALHAFELHLLEVIQLVSNPQKTACLGANCLMSVSDRMTPSSANVLSFA